MGAPLETIDVGGRSFQFAKLAPADAVPAFWELAPAMEAAERAGASGGNPMATLMKEIPPGRIFELMKTLFKSVTLNGSPIDANFTFGDGANKDAFEVFGHAIRVNYASFLGEKGSPSSAGAETK